MPSFPKFACAIVVIVFLLIAAAPGLAQGVWSATLTVSRVEIPLPTFGYFNPPRFDIPDLPPAAGSLSDTEFVANGERYTVHAMYVQTNSSGRRVLAVALSAPFTGDDWGFTVDGETFVVNEAFIHQEFDHLPGLDWIIWDAAVLAWPEGQRISVGLTDPQSVPVLPVPALGILLGLLSAAGYRARRKRVR